MNMNTITVQAVEASTMYGWKQGCSLTKHDPQVIGERLEKLADLGKLLPGEVVESARPKRSPLHPLFEWDDDTAARKYREVQASYVIRSVTIKSVGDEDFGNKVRAFVTLKSTRTAQPYETTISVMFSRDKRERLLSIARRELQDWRDRYFNFEEFAEIFEAIENFRWN